MSLGNSFKNGRTELLEPVSFYYRDFDNSFSMPFHEHSYYEFMMCIKGHFEYEYITKSGNIESVTVNEKEIIFINPLIPHRLAVSSPSNVTIANIEFVRSPIPPSDIQKQFDYSSFFEKTLLPNMTNPLGYYVLKDTALIESSLIQLVNCINEPHTYDLIDKAFFIQSFFYELKSSLTKRKEGQYAFVRNAISYIQDHLKENLTIEAIAEIVKKSPSYFAHKFKEDRGMSVLKYINKTRIDKACFLLKQTPLSISSIAKEVGFSSKDQLNYQFHAVMQCTPSEYKHSLVYKQIVNRSTKAYQAKDFHVK